MVVPDLDIPQTNDGAETKRKERKLANKIYAVEELLKKKYFFTQEQLYDILHKNTDHDGYFYEQIIHDVEQKFTSSSLPQGASINEYLYQSLMNIEPLDMREREQYIINSTHDILYARDTQILSYDQFVRPDLNNDIVRKQLKTYVKDDVQDFFVLHINEDDLHGLTLPHTMLDFSNGTSLYVFVQKDSYRFVVKYPADGVHPNRLDSLANKYNATTVTIPLSHFSQTL